MFQNSFNGKQVLVTGATGFKGSWLCMWLLRLGANVTGYSMGIPTKRSLFEDANLADRITHVFGDVRDAKEFESTLIAVQPDYVFHMAAQPIVSVSYRDPVQTFETNVMGTVTVLEGMRKVTWPCVAIFITSDKCYENVEWVWGYREIDALGGKDIYSASKAAAEVAIRSYYRSYFSQAGAPVRLASVRAGNVIGGGDWAEDRIVVDCIKSWMDGRPVTIRSPMATRPWQHVLEPLSGYLCLAATLSKSDVLKGEAFNFGPRSDANKTVLQLLNDLRSHWSEVDPYQASVVQNEIIFNEATLLQLNCDKAQHHLGWTATLDYAECVEMVGKWYDSVCVLNHDSFNLSNEQIAKYEAVAQDRKQLWTQG